MVFIWCSPVYALSQIHLPLPFLVPEPYKVQTLQLIYYQLDNFFK